MAVTLRQDMQEMGEGYMQNLLETLSAKENILWKSPSAIYIFNNFAGVNGGGIMLVAEISCVAIQVYIYNTTMSHNEANLGGGHIHIKKMLSYEPFKNESFISIENSSFYSGRAGAIGGGFIFLL